MSNKKDWRAELEQVAEKLRDPIRMRLAVAAVAVAIMYFGISEPLYGRMKQHTPRAEATGNNRFNRGGSITTARPVWERSSRES